MSNPTFLQLRRGLIVGAIIEGKCAVVFEPSYTFAKTHYDHWKDAPEVCFRWDSHSSLTFSIRSKRRATTAEKDLIQKTLSDVFGILWFENGHYDWEHFTEEVKKEKSLAAKEIK